MNHRSNREIISRLALAMALALGPALLAWGCGESSTDSSGGSSSNGTVHPEDFLPSGDEQWQAQGVITATTEAELQQAIDGGYTTYVEHGFQEFAGQDYAGQIDGTSVTLTVWIFKLETEQDAAELHIDDDIVQSGCEEISGLGTEARFCSSLMGLRIEFRRGSFWCRLDLSGSTSEEARTQLETFAQSVDSELPR